MSLARRRVADAIAGAAPDLARAWRAARAGHRPEVFPGLLDGIIEPFFSLVAGGLADQGDPALIWPAVTGVVRLLAREARRTRAELDAEWRLAEEVLHAACRALDADPAAREWVSQAVAVARAGAARLPDRQGAPGVLAVPVYSAPAATRRARGPSPR